MLRLILAALILLAPLPARAQGPEPLFGEWEVRPEPGTSDYVRTMCTIEPVSGEAESGLFRVSYDLVGTRGGVAHLEWTGRLDGEDYRVFGVDYVMTNAYEQIDTRTFRIVTKVEGQTLTTAETTVSPDARMMTTVTRGRSASGDEVATTVIYERLR